MPLTAGPVDSGADGPARGVETGMEIGDWVAGEVDGTAPDDSPLPVVWPAIGEPARCTFPVWTPLV